MEINNVLWALVACVIPKLSGLQGHRLIPGFGLQNSPRSRFPRSGSSDNTGLYIHYQLAKPQDYNFQGQGLTHFAAVAIRAHAVVAVLNQGS